MKKRLIGAMLAMAMATTMLGGCGSTASTDTAPAEGTEATDTADAAEDTAKRAVVTLEGWIDCFDKARFAGGFNAGGLNDANAIEEHTEWLPKAFALGKQI